MFFFRREYKNDIVAELAWAIGSAPLLSDNKKTNVLSISPSQWISSQFDNHLSWLEELDKDPSALRRFLDGHPNQLLGKRFETLLNYWFSESPFLSILHSNVQLRDENSTSGEIDFIIENKESGQIIHCEAACKYFLSSLGTPDWASWKGPNAEDSLLNKMNKLHRQLTIFKRPEGELFLRNNGLSPPLSLMFLKGYFFHRYNELGKSSSPKHHHPNYNSGWWMHRQDITALAKSPAQWLILPRSRWIGPYYNWDNHLPVLTGNELELILFTGEKPFRPTMIIQLDESRSEISRGIIVPDKWPELS